MRLVVTSDTHNNYPELPDGDVLIHCGDLTANGTMEELDRAFGWLIVQPHKHKLLVAGNHDQALEGFSMLRPDGNGGLTLLKDREVTVDGLRVYGTPWTPLHQDFAFMLPPDKLREKFMAIPSGLDVLITHGPPFDVLDYASHDRHLGSCELKDALRKLRVRPRVHVFGHIHESYGMKIDFGNPISYNVSWVGLDLDGHPKPPNPPVIIDI